MVVNVVDAICGVGKSSSLINRINEDNSANKYLYITPFLSEVERIKTCCPDKNFKEPKRTKKKNKLEDIKLLFEAKENIVSTHSLFKKITPEIVELIKKEHYILVMDEVADVVDVMDITTDDMKTILNNYVKINDDRTLTWTADNYEGKFDGYKEEIQNNKVLASISKAGVPHSFVSFFPIQIFQAFKEIYVLTYMFDCQVQKYYFDIYDTKYVYWYVDNMHLTLEPQKYDEKKIKDLIQIYSSPKLNKIGDGKFALSSSWFDRNKKDGCQELKKNTYNFFRNIASTHSGKALWTTFKSAKSDLKGKGFSKGFVPINIRATNEYADRVAVAYLANKYFHPLIKTFFKENGVTVDEDKYALSELIQFIFRSAIRKGQEIIIYIPSERMRNILQKWIDNN